MTGARLDFSARARRRPRAETGVPMINVVFLLLIFFLMAASIAPPDPLEVTLPRVAGEAPQDGPAASALYLAADGTLAFGDLRGDAALEAAASAAGEAPLRIAADTRLEAAELARLLTRLGGLGLGEVALAVEAP
jgi:biopolymer transport protein ExbD